MLSSSAIIQKRMGASSDSEPKKTSREQLKKGIEYYLTNSALNRGLRFRYHENFALISGAGIAGLAASFELLAKGFKVVIAEKRKSFDRFNVINLDVESQRFLRKFGLLKEFEKTVAGRISTHKLVLAEEKGSEVLGTDDVTKLKPSDIPFEPEFFSELFKAPGIYSVRIKDLQAFLAQKATEAGVQIYFNVDVDVINRTQEGGVSAVRISGKDGFSDPMLLQPDLFFVAEGAHSVTATQLGMETKEVINECTGENWIFGSVKYFGQETFVISVVDTTEENVMIANLIFNSQIHEVNVAVTSQKFLSQEQIQERILALLGKVISFQNIDEVGPKSLIATVKQPVRIKNEQRAIYSKGNAFCIGDAAGHSSPLAGMGGTLGLTLVPRTVEKLVNDSKVHPERAHDNFSKFSDGYTSRWIAKSQAVKTFCLSTFKSKTQAVSDKEQDSSAEDELTQNSIVPK